MLNLESRWKFESENPIREDTNGESLKTVLAVKRWKTLERENGGSRYATRAFATPIFVASATPIFVASATPYFRISATQTAATPKILF